MLPLLLFVLFKKDAPKQTWNSRKNTFFLFTELRKDSLLKYEDKYILCKLLLYCIKNYLHLKVINNIHSFKSTNKFFRIVYTNDKKNFAFTFNYTSPSHTCLFLLTLRYLFGCIRILSIYNLSNLEKKLLSQWLLNASSSINKFFTWRISERANQIKIRWSNVQWLCQMW